MDNINEDATVRVLRPEEACAGALVMDDDIGEQWFYFDDEDEVRVLRDNLNELLGEVSEKGRATTVVLDAVRQYIDVFDYRRPSVPNLREQATAFHTLRTAYRTYEEVA